MDTPQPQISETVHLKDYLHSLRRRRGIILLFFITVVLLVAVASFIMTPIYRATTTLLIDVESPDVLTASGMVALESQNYYTYKEYYESQKEIITSRAIARKVFDEFNLAKTKKYGTKDNPIKKFLRETRDRFSQFRMEETREYTNAEDPIKKFLKTITVEPVRDTRLLKLHVENEDPELAAKIANRIAEIFVKRNLYYISRAELMNLLKNEYLKLESKMSEYNKIYKSKHPKMIRLKQEIGEMVKRIDEVKQSAFNYEMVDTDFSGDKQYTLEGLKANNVSIEDPAEVPVQPVKPKELLNILLAIVVGIFGGVGLAFFVEYLDDTVKNLEDIERFSEWPFLGNVPTIHGGWRMTELRKNILMHTKPKDPAAEAYRAIRTNIFFSSTEERPLRTMLVVSPGSQEGKTTTLCNLGIAIAQSQKKVLLVDADMRKPRLHEVFRKQNKKGLSDFLCGQAPIADVIQATEIENVTLITGGPHPPNPSELLSTHRMRELITYAKEKYDFILFDTPPVSMVTDAVVLSHLIDGVIMIVESGKTSKRALPRIYRILTDVNARVIGTVLNKISKAASHYYYYHYYYYGKYYGKK